MITGLDVGRQCSMWQASSKVVQCLGTFVQGFGSVTEMAPHLSQASPASGRHSTHTQQPQFRMTGSLSSLAQDGLLHKKSAVFQRGSLAGRACTVPDL